MTSVDKAKRRLGLSMLPGKERTERAARGQTPEGLPFYDDPSFERFCAKAASLAPGSALSVGALLCSLQVRARPPCPPAAPGAGAPRAAPGASRVSAARAWFRLSC